MARKNKNKARAKDVEETELDVEEVEVVETKPAKPPAGIETWLIFVTFFALLWGMFVINVKLHEVSGKGWPF